MFAFETFISIIKLHVVFKYRNSLCGTNGHRTNANVMTLLHYLVGIKISHEMTSKQSDKVTNHLGPLATWILFPLTASFLLASCFISHFGKKHFNAIGFFFFGGSCSSNAVIACELV